MTDNPQVKERGSEEILELSDQRDLYKVEYLKSKPPFPTRCRFHR